MQIKKLWIAYFIIMLLIFPALAIPVSSDENPLPLWDNNWSYRDEIKLPISTYDSYAIFQPIDLHIEFQNPCWGKNENEHSVRVCCWDGNSWYELDSQIYDIEQKDPLHINKCGLVFLVPEMANGEERYFVYYDDAEKPSPNYPNHVDIEDSYYYYEPISGIALEGDYYQIKENGFAVYAVGQKGKIINRPLSQVVIGMKPNTKEFDTLTSDDIATLAFGYNYGPNDEDQTYSDDTLISKEIRIDGNLMVEFGIVSESDGKELRTTNIYRYYYCPTKNKRISVHVKHQVFEEGIIRGQINADGTYGTLLSYRSKSRSIPRMDFGKLLPYLHVSGVNNQIKEYNMNPNPESKSREWTIPYTDDCDLGEGAWISYDEGESGKAFGIIFSSNKDIVKYGQNERDGIQITSMEKEYLDVLGAEIDFTSVVFGRNSYEKGGRHDLNIADDLVVEFDAELFSTLEGGYEEVIKEGEYFRTLIKHRQADGIDLDKSDKNIYTLTVLADGTGGFLTFPIFTKLTGITISNVTAELYQNDVLVAASTAIRPSLGHLKIKFPKLAAGSYIVRVYRQTGKKEKELIGLQAVQINGDKTIRVFCTWEQSIKITAKDQYGKRIEGIELSLFRNSTTLIRDLTHRDNDTIIKVNYNFYERYRIEGYYKGFTVFNEEMQRNQNTLDITLNLYDLAIDIHDKLGFSPGVNVRPFLTSSEMNKPIELMSEGIRNGKYEFENLPAASYKLYLSYGRFSDEMTIDVPKNGESADIKFSAVFDLKTTLLDSRGSKIEDSNLQLEIKREGNILFESISPNEVINLPPGRYTIKAYSDDKLVGIKTIELSSDKNVNIVTIVKSTVPILVCVLVLVFIIEIIALIISKKISLNTFLKLLALSLVILSLFQPWWILNGHNEDPSVEKTSEMFILPQTMVESITYEDGKHLELATLPEMFTDFVGTLLLIIYSGIALLSISFISNILLKKRFFMILISASIIFLTLVSLAFSFGMSKITELSLGSLNGEGIIDVLLPNGETVCMNSIWGLGTGFYFCMFSALILIATGVIDFLSKKEWSKRMFSKN